MDLELQKMALIREGKMSASALNEGITNSQFDVLSNLRMMPKFTENDVNFCLFVCLNVWLSQEVGLMRSKP